MYDTGLMIAIHRKLWYKVSKDVRFLRTLFRLLLFSWRTVVVFVSSEGNFRFALYGNLILWFYCIVFSNWPIKFTQKEINQSAREWYNVDNFSSAHCVTSSRLVHSKLLHRTEVRRNPSYSSFCSREKECWIYASNLQQLFPRSSLCRLNGGV